MRNLNCLRNEYHKVKQDSAKSVWDEMEALIRVYDIEDMLKRLESQKQELQKEKSLKIQRRDEILVMIRDASQLRNMSKADKRRLREVLSGLMKDFGIPRQSSSGACIYTQLSLLMHTLDT